MTAEEVKQLKRFIKDNRPIVNGNQVVVSTFDYSTFIIIECFAACFQVVIHYSLSLEAAIQQYKSEVNIPGPLDLDT